MGREIRRVPEGWQHPRDERGHYKPLYDEPYAARAERWLQGLMAFERNEGNRKDKAIEEGERYFWDWDSMPPNREYHRPDWSPDEATHYQIYETVSEGTPVSPVFETEDEMIAWLIAQGHSERAARAFVRSGWAPSMIMSGGVLYSDIDSFDAVGKPEQSF